MERAFTITWSLAAIKRVHFFDGVFPIPPRHFLIATDKRLQLSKYWDFNYPATADAAPGSSDAEYAEEFREAFDDAVGIGLRADVPVAYCLAAESTPVQFSASHRGTTESPYAPLR